MSNVNQEGGGAGSATQSGPYDRRDRNDQDLHKRFTKLDQNGREIRDVLLAIKQQMGQTDPRLLEVLTHLGEHLEETMRKEEILLGLIAQHQGGRPAETPRPEPVHSRPSDPVLEALGKITARLDAQEETARKMYEQGAQAQKAKVEEVKAEVKKEVKEEVKDFLGKTKEKIVGTTSFSEDLLKPTVRASAIGLGAALGVGAGVLVVGAVGKMTGLVQ